MIAGVTMAFQNAATTGDGLTQFLPEPKTVRFRVTGNGSVSAGAVTIECCPGNAPTTPTGSSSLGATWTALTMITVPANTTTEYRADSVVGSVRARISTPITGATVTVLGVFSEEQKGWSRRSTQPRATSSG